MAQQLTTDVLAGGRRTVTVVPAQGAAAGAAARRPGTAVAVLADGAGGRVLAAFGGGPAGLGDPAARAPGVLGASCAAGSVPAGGPDALAETVPVVLGGHRIASVVVWQPVDDAWVAGLRQQLGITDDLVLLRAPDGLPAQAAAARRSVAAATMPRGDVAPVLSAVTSSGPGAARMAGVAGGLRYAARPGADGAPCAVLAVAPPGAGLARHTRAGPAGRRAGGAQPWSP